MERPDTCPVEMYEIMLDCWERSPYARPVFSAIEERISNCMQQNAHNVSNYCSCIPGFIGCGVQGKFLILYEKISAEKRELFLPKGLEQYFRKSMENSVFFRYWLSAGRSPFSNMKIS